MGIQDREWYREAQKGKQRRGQWNGNNQSSPLNKTTLLYLSLSINVMLGLALYYAVH
jgi:hypothetical protein